MATHDSVPSSSISVVRPKLRRGTCARVREVGRGLCLCYFSAILSLYRRRCQSLSDLSVVVSCSVALPLCLTASLPELLQCLRASRLPSPLFPPPLQPPT
eukprot:1625068-Pleurochrysis_carterae.AAC.1